MLLRNLDIFSGILEQCQTCRREVLNQSRLFEHRIGCTHWSVIARQGWFYRWGDDAPVGPFQSEEDAEDHATTGIDLDDEPEDFDEDDEKPCSVRSIR